MIGGKRRLLESEDCWNAKICGKRMRKSRRNEVSADEWSETKVVGKTNVGENQKWGGRLSEKSNIPQ